MPDMVQEGGEGGERRGGEWSARARVAVSQVSSRVRSRVSVRLRWLCLLPSAGRSSLLFDFDSVPFSLFFIDN